MVPKVHLFQTHLQPMALKGILLLLHLGARVQILHRHPALDTAQHVPAGVGEGSYAAGLELEAGVSSLLHVAHVAQVPYEHLATGCSDDEFGAGYG